jgi:hypothetical protein
MPTISIPAATIRRLTVLIGAVAALAALPATAAAGPVFPTAADDPTGLVMHQDPDSGSPRTGTVPSGGNVEILCQVDGTSESDPKYGTSRLWDRVKNVADGTVGYVTDLYVLSNQDRIDGVPTCDVPPPPPGGARPSWVPAEYWTLLQDAAVKEALDAKLLAGQLKVESNFDPDVCSEAGACGIAQFLPGTWRGDWNPYRDQPEGYFDPRLAIPAQARFMHNLLETARTKDGAAIKAQMASRGDIPAETLDAIDFNDPYQIALMAYHAGWDLSGWGPRTAKYPVNITSQARRP